MPPATDFNDDRETPSGKSAKDENFPVGSFLLPRALRPHVATYYAFARAIDDVADNPDLASEDKISRLRGFEAVLDGTAENAQGYEKATALRASMLETGVPTRHGTDLITAFVQDAVQSRYRDWAGLIGYCENSANPVGRYLLDLHGEDPAGYRQSDALCTILQILNHLQDCGDDLAQLGRCYIPMNWLDEEGCNVEDLRAGAMVAGLCRVKDRMLDGCAVLMQDAQNLAATLRNRRLAMESEIIVRLATRLSGRLRRGDPLAERVALSRADFAMAGGAGAIHGFLRAGTGVRDERDQNGKSATGNPA